MTALMFTTHLIEYLKPTIETYCSEKRFLSKYFCSLMVHLVTQELSLMVMYNEINDFMPANTPSIVKPMDQRILIFKSYYVRNMFCKSVAAI